MLVRSMLRQRVTTSRRLASPLLQVRKVVIPPRHSRNTIASRDPDRPLPPLPTTALKRWGTTLPIFALIIGLSAAAIFNYEKSSSSVVNSTLYALRTNPQARELLGDEIYFRDKIPWIWGELHPMRGTIDVGFAVKGTKEAGFMRFKSLRRGGKSGKFKTEEWSLEMPDGTRIELLDHNSTEQFSTLPGTS